MSGGIDWKNIGEKALDVVGGIGAAVAGGLVV
jgi:hypothetical protein